MAWRWSGDKQLSEPMMVSLLTHICVNRPQWIKHRRMFNLSQCSNEFWCVSFHFINSQSHTSNPFRLPLFSPMRLTAMLAQSIRTRLLHCFEYQFFVTGYKMSFWLLPISDENWLKWHFCFSWHSSKLPIFWLGESLDYIKHALHWHFVKFDIFLLDSFMLHFATMTSSNGNIFRGTDPLCREFTGRRWIPLTQASDAELLSFHGSAWTNDRVNNRDAGDPTRLRAHFDVTVMAFQTIVCSRQIDGWRHQAIT